MEAVLWILATLLAAACVSLFLWGLRWRVEAGGWESLCSILMARMSDPPAVAPGPAATPPLVPSAEPKPGSDGDNTQPPNKRWPL